MQENIKLQPAKKVNQENENASGLKTFTPPASGISPISLPPSPNIIQRLQALPEQERPETLQPNSLQKIQRKKQEEDKPKQLKKEEDETKQLKKDEEEKPKQLKSGESNFSNPSHKSKSGLPNNLKEGVESLSGISMNDVQVHYNSSKPKSVDALAYAQGTDIHLGPGQEKHLPHEAWHIVQQKKGNVKETTQSNGVSINDSPQLEKEADDMGKMALQRKGQNQHGRELSTNSSTIQRQPDGDKNTQGYEWPSDIAWPAKLLGPRRNFPSGYHNAILSTLVSIENTKNRIAQDWSSNMNEKDFKPGEFLLALALDIVGNGISAAFKIAASKAFQNISGDLTKEFITQTVHKTIEDNFDNARGSVQDMINSKDYSQEDLMDSAKKGNSDSQAKNLKQYYLSSMGALFTKERDNKVLNVTSIVSPSELGLALLLNTFQKAYNEIDSNNSMMQQSLTVGYMKLLDSIYLNSKAKDYDGKDDKEKLKNMYAKDDKINEVYEREGNLIVLDERVSASIGHYKNPVMPGLRGIVSGSINNTVAQTLKGARIADLPFSLGFRFWGSLGTMTGSMTKVWFTVRPDKTVAVDMDESWQSDSGGNFDGGREWMARYYLQTDKELSEDDIRSNVANGAAKLYNNLKNSTLGSVANYDLF